MGFPRKMLMAAIASAAAPTSEALKLQKTSTTLLKKVAAHSVMPDGFVEFVRRTGRADGMLLTREVAQEMWNQMAPTAKAVMQEMVNFNAECEKGMGMLVRKKSPTEAEISDFLDKCFSPELHDAVREEFRGQARGEQPSNQNKQGAKKTAVGGAAAPPLGASPAGPQGAGPQDDPLLREFASLAPEALVKFPALVEEIKGMDEKCREAASGLLKSKKTPSDSEIEAFMKKCVSEPRHDTFKKLVQQLKKEGGSGDDKNAAGGGAAAPPLGDVPPAGPQGAGPQDDPLLREFASLEAVLKEFPALAEELNRMDEKCREAASALLNKSKKTPSPSDSEIEAFMKKCISEPRHDMFKKLVQQVKKVEGSGDKNKKKEEPEPSSNSSC